MKTTTQRCLFWTLLAIAALYGALFLGGVAFGQQINLQTQVKGLLPPANGGSGLDTSAVTGCPKVTVGVWSFNSANCSGSGGSAAGGSFSIQYANGATFAGASFTGLVKNNGASGPPAAALAADVTALFPGTSPCFLKSDGTCATPFSSTNGIVFNTSTVASRNAVAGDFPTLNQSTTGNAATATALAGPPTQCGGTNPFAAGIQANGNANCVSYIVLPITGDTADYRFNQGSGTTLLDFSGNGNNGTLGAGSSTMPTWTPVGLAFNIQSNGGYDGVGQNGVQLPSALNNSKTIFMAVYLNTLVPTGGIANAPHYPVFLTSSLGGSGVNLMNWYTNPALNSIGNYGLGIFANGVSKAQASNQISGFHVLAWTLGTGSGDLDHMYVDGTEVPNYLAQSSSYGFQSSGNYYIGSSNTGTWASQNTAFFGTMYRAVFYPTELTASQVATVSASIANEASSRGVQTTPVSLALGTPTLNCVGDSITYGLNVPTPFCGLLSLDASQPAYTILNWGIDSITINTINGMDPNRVALRCKSTEGPTLAVVEAGTNDLFFGNLTTLAVVSYLAGEVQTLKNAGCRVFVGTMISRTGNQTGSGTSMDTLKDAYDADVLSQAQQMGADGVIDFAANPLLGADGAYSNTTYYQVDGVHPTTAGQQLMANAMSNTLNYYNGYKATNPHVVTANTYSMASGDGYVLAQPTAAAAYTLPDCTGPSGAIYTINNTSTFALTVTGLNAAQTVNGLTAAVQLPGGISQLKIVAQPKSTAGCVWVMEGTNALQAVTSPLTLAVSTCGSTTVTMPGLTQTMDIHATAQVDPGAGTVINAFWTTPDIAKVEVCTPSAISWTSVVMNVVATGH